jgi:serine-aspartate repeat-containing protein C/D/E
MRHYSILIGVVLLSFGIIGIAGAAVGNYSVAWNRTYGGPGASDSAAAIIRNPQEAGYFLAGKTASFGAGKSDAWMVRLDEAGNEEWNRTYGGKEADDARSLIDTPDKNLLFAGTLTFVSNETLLDTDAWVGKIDLSGTDIWNRTYGGPDVNASADAVIGTPDGGYLFVGSIAPWGTPSTDAWVVRLNATGEEVWNRTYGGAGNDTANSVTQTSGGEFVFAGSTESAGAGMADVWVVMLNATGEEVWNRTYGGLYDDTSHSVITAVNGDLVVAGTFSGMSDGVTVDTDALLMQFNPAGTILWNWSYGDPGMNESANAVIGTADAGYLFAGETGFAGTDDTDAWLVKTDGKGAVEWNKVLGGANPGDMASAVLQTAGDAYAFAGTLNATGPMGPVNNDAWAVALGPFEKPSPTPTLIPSPTSTPTPKPKPIPSPTSTPTPKPKPTLPPAKPPKAPKAPEKPSVTVLPTPSPPQVTPTETLEPKETPEPKDTPEPKETPEPTDTPEPEKPPKAPESKED